MPAASALPKAGSQVGSVDTAASLGSNAVAAMAGVAAETPGGGSLEEVLRQLQDKYTMWQQRLDALIAQVRILGGFVSTASMHACMHAEACGCIHCTGRAGGVWRAAA